ncbi:EamA family transporter [Pyrofollis japonicus]|nr:EamA family transporter [Pyrofollis japonicus]
MRSSGVVYVYLAAVAWSTIAVATKYGYLAGCSPSGVLLGRQLLAALLTVLGALGGIYKWSVVLDRRVAFIGAVVFAPFYASFYYGVELLGVAREEVLLYTAPLWVLVYELVLEARRPSPASITASLLVLAGAVAMASEAWVNGGLGLAGFTVGLLSGALYAASIYCSACLAKGLDPLSLAAGVQFWLLLGALPISLAIGAPRVTTGCLPSLVYLAVVISHLSYIAFYRGLSKGVDAHRASIAATIELVLGVVWGIVLFGEPVTTSFLLGSSLIILAQIVPTLQRGRSKLRVECTEGTQRENTPA